MIPVACAEVNPKQVAEVEELIAAVVATAGMAEAAR
jgi:hypothetical protein